MIPGQVEYRVYNLRGEQVAMTTDPTQVVSLQESVGSGWTRSIQVTDDGDGAMIWEVRFPSAPILGVWQKGFDVVKRT